MPWALLLDLRVLLSIALVAVGIYAKVQSLGWQQCKAEYTQFQADIDREASASKVKAAQEAARHAKNSQEALDGLQTRYDALDARYRRLRQSATSGGTVPTLSSAASVAQACPIGEPDTAARRMGEIEARIAAVLEAGDKELAKYRELWRLNEANKPQ